MRGRSATAARQMGETLRASQGDWRAHDEPPRLLLTVNDACRAIGMTRTTFYREVGRGHLIVLKDGGRTKVPYFTLVAYVRRLCDEQGVTYGDDVALAG